MYIYVFLGHSAVQQKCRNAVNQLFSNQKRKKKNPASSETHKPVDSAPHTSGTSPAPPGLSRLCSGPQGTSSPGLLGPCSLSPQGLSSCLSPARNSSPGSQPPSGHVLPSPPPEQLPHRSGLHQPFLLSEAHLTSQGYMFPVVCGQAASPAG